MSPITVGIIGANGRVGKPVYQALLQAQNEGKVKVVVLERNGVDKSKYEAEVREMDLETPDEELNKKAVEGLNIVLSLLGAAGIKLQFNLVQTLAGSKSLKTFVPSEYGAPWTADEFVIPQLAPLDLKNKVVDKAKELGVPVTIMKGGTITPMWFQHKRFGVNAQDNIISLYPGAEKNPNMIVSPEYIGAVLTHLITTRPHDLAGKTFSLWEHEFLASEYAEVLTKIHGAPTKIESYTEEDFQADLTKGFPMAITGGLRRKWGLGFEFQGEIVKAPGWKAKSLEEVNREYLNM